MNEFIWESSWIIDIKHYWGMFYGIVRQKLSHEAVQLSFVIKNTSKIYGLVMLTKFSNYLQHLCLKFGMNPTQYSWFTTDELSARVCWRAHPREFNLHENFLILLIILLFLINLNYRIVYLYVKAPSKLRL